MTKSLEVEARMIEGFKAEIADAKLYQAIEQGSAEKFGKDSRAYQTVMNGVNTANGTGSQFFFNTEAGLYLPEGKRVMTLADMGRISDADKDQTFFDGSFYTDTPELVLRSATPSWKHNAKILEQLVKQAEHRGLSFSPENPLVLSGLELARDENSDNPYGILLNITDATKTRNDNRFAYGNNRITTGSKERTLWTKKDGL